MILADKIIRLRKMNGWSQEELAEKMKVSRQAVSKWEAAQSTPDLEKILMLGNIFGVTTDYLLKDEFEEEEFTEDIADCCRSVTMEDANIYIKHRQWAAKRIALATFLCILSPVCMMLLGAVSENSAAGISESTASMTGLMILFMMVAAAVANYLYVGAQNAPYRYLEAEEFKLAYGVSGMVKEKQKNFRESYTRGNIAATCLCILAPLILFAGAFTGHELTVMVCLCIMLLIIGIAVGMFIFVGVQWVSMQRILQEGDFSGVGKRRSKIKDTVGSIFWLLAAAVYLVWSFWTDAWDRTWVVWPVAGVLFAALMAAVNLFADRNDESDDRRLGI